jgi:SNF2 family DNA or RNA helicase
MCDKGNRLGRTFDAFSTRWFRASPDGYGTVALPHAEAEIKELLKDICVTIDPKDYFDLKEPVVINVGVDLPAKVRELYKEMEANYFMQLESGHEIEAFNGAAKSMKLLQICSGAAYIDTEADSDSHKNAREFKVLHDEKLDALDDIIEESGGSPIIVTFQFKSDLARLLKKYPDGRQLAIPEQLVEFKSGKWRLAFAHPASTGHGIDGLQKHCFTMVNYSQSWNLEQTEQMLGRIAPIRQFQAGFTRNVFVYNLIANDTIDEVVAERITTKASIQDSLVQAMKRRKETS